MTAPVELTPQSSQPYTDRRLEVVEPEWQRFPGWRHVTPAEWASPRWQRVQSIRSTSDLFDVTGGRLGEPFYRDLDDDQRHVATMRLLITPQMLNTIAPLAEPGPDVFYADPVRRYVLPALSDRERSGMSHPLAQRDPLHEADMWVVPGLTHRYPRKVLAEVTTTCPQYCGHCTRTDLVGKSTNTFEKVRFASTPVERLRSMIDYVAATPTVHDVVVSGGDVADVPWSRLEWFVTELLQIDSVRDIRLATKALVGLPQHFLQSEIRAGFERLAGAAAQRSVRLAVHTHANACQQVTPGVIDASRALRDAGLRDIRNQGVLLRGVNDTADALLDLCFAIYDQADITPYYFYLCDIVPNAEHWRLALWEAQQLQIEIMGYLPGFATPRLVCDVPLAGKFMVHQAEAYDRERGISYWRKNFWTTAERRDAPLDSRRYLYFDPVHPLPPAGRRWWGERTAADLDELRGAEP